ncbi:MAG: WYL domain-containing protein, partial [Parasporobacterium sp.]|nr:WYL domain-containing protein [Parasporobacterium sp.]
HFAVVGGFKAFWNKGRRYDLTLQAIETIDRAIDQDAKIRFRYFWYSMQHKATFPQDEMYRHIVSPLVRVLEDGYFYLIALCEDGKIRHYRLDRMTAIDLLEEKRGLLPDSPCANMNWKEYVNSSFGLGLTYPTEYLVGYHAPTPVTNLLITVSLKFTRDLVGVVMDRFGRDVILTPTDKGHFIATFQAYQNAQFMSWLVGLGKKVQVITPTEFRKDLSRFARQTGCWHNYSRFTAINEYNAWKRRVPYWSTEDESESRNESRRDGIWK